MKTTIFTVILVLLIFSGVVYLNKQKNAVAPDSNMSFPPDMHTSEIALDLEGTYAGITPCADCEGIKTTVILSKDNKYTYQMQYLGKGDDTVYVDTGTFRWNENGLIIHLEGGDTAGKPLDIKVEENQLRLLDMDGNVITGNLADMYILEKQGLP